MSYLEQLKNLNTPAKGTAFTAKSTSSSKGSNDLARFQKSTPPSGSKDSSIPAHFQKIKPPIGSKGSSDTTRFQKITSPGISGEVPSTVAPALCAKSCEHFHLSVVADLPPVARCWQVQDGKDWSTTRLDRMTVCPLTTDAEPTPPAPTNTPTTTGPEVIGLACGGCGSTKYKRVPNGYIFPDGGRTDGWFCGSPGCGAKLLITSRAEENLSRQKMNPMNDTTENATRFLLDGIEAKPSPLAEQIVQGATETGHPADNLNPEDHPLE